VTFIRSACTPWGRPQPYGAHVDRLKSVIVRGFFGLPRLSSGEAPGVSRPCVCQAVQTSKAHRFTPSFAAHGRRTGPRLPFCKRLLIPRNTVEVDLHSDTPQQSPGGIEKVLSQSWLVDGCPYAEYRVDLSLACSSSVRRQLFR
jgi:hypothetical protein